MRLPFAALALIVPAVSPGIAMAQTYACSVPTNIGPIRPEQSSAREPRRVLPIGGYTLAITWAPQFCHDKGDAPNARFQCASGNRFGFTLHGLWPDGTGETWPQYCTATPLLRPALIRQHLCATPSAQLLQHEWAKHGTCMKGYRPARYFQQSNALYARLRYPDMAALSRQASLTAGGVAGAIARANPGLGANMMRVTRTKRGWLDEIWICLDTAFRYQRCPAGQGGLDPGDEVKVWRGEG